MHQSRTLYIGRDVHKDSIAGASVAKDHDAAVISLGTFGTRQCDSDTRVRKLPSKATPLVFVYEAGPWGDWLYCYLTKKDDGCWVGAPSLMPKQAGDRVTTDRRDARQLARLMRAGDLPAVYVPAVDDAALRALRRARADTRRALQAATLRLKAFVLRHDLRSTGRAHWSPAPLRWLSAVVGPPPAPPIVLQADVQTVTAPTERLGRLERALHEQGHTWRFAPVVEAWQALRGVQCTVAVPTVAERGDLTRCDTPRHLMPYLGLTPSAYSRGSRRQQGGMTTTGTTPARRALVEGAWASRSPATVRRHHPLRLEQLPTAIQALSWKAQVRLWTRYRPLMATGKHANHGGVAMARAWRALLWAMATHGALRPKAERWRLVAAKALHGAHVHRQSRSPGVGSPSAA